MPRLFIAIFALTAACAAAPLRPATPISAPRDPEPALRAQADEVAADIAANLGARAGRVGVMAGDDDAGELAAALDEHLQNAVLRTGLRVVERARLQNAMRELRIASGDLFDAAAAPKAGKLLGIDLLAVTHVTRDADAWRWHVRVIEVASGAVRYSGSFTLQPSDELRRLTGAALPGTLVVFAPDGARVMLGLETRVATGGKAEFTLPAGEYEVGVLIDSLSGATRVRVPERGVAELRPEVFHRPLDTRIIWVNAVIPGLSFVDDHGAWTGVPALGFYAALGATIYDANNRSRGFVTQAQQQAADHAYREAMLYDYAALGGFYALTLAGAAVQASKISRGGDTIRWALAPRPVKNGAAIVLAYEF